MRSSPPALLQVIRAVNRFGVLPVMGRSVLSAGEIRRFALVENIIAWHAERKAAKDWVKWGRENPHKAATLHRAHLIFATIYPDEVEGEIGGETGGEIED